jgi:hypothetical protein
MTTMTTSLSTSVLTANLEAVSYLPGWGHVCPFWGNKPKQFDQPPAEVDWSQWLQRGIVLGVSIPEGAEVRVREDATELLFGTDGLALLPCPKGWTIANNRILAPGERDPWEVLRFLERHLEARGKFCETCKGQGNETRCCHCGSLAEGPYCGCTGFSDFYPCTCESCRGTGIVGAPANFPDWKWRDGAEKAAQAAQLPLVESTGRQVAAAQGYRLIEVTPGYWGWWFFTFDIGARPWWAFLQQAPINEKFQEAIAAYNKQDGNWPTNQYIKTWSTDGRWYLSCPDEVARSVI